MLFVRKISVIALGFGLFASLAVWMDFDDDGDGYLFIAKKSAQLFFNWLHEVEG